MLAEMKSDQEIVGWRWWLCYGHRYTGEARLRSAIMNNLSDWVPRRMPMPAIHYGDSRWCNLCGFDLLENPGRCPGHFWYDTARDAYSVEERELYFAHSAAHTIICPLSEHDRVGYHAYRNPQEFQNSVHEWCIDMYALYIVVGTVSLWGKVRVYKEGYRAQYAYPRTLYVADSDPAMRLALSQAYGVEAYPRSALPFRFMTPAEAKAALERNRIRGEHSHVS